MMKVARKAAELAKYLSLSTYLKAYHE